MSNRSKLREDFASETGGYQWRPWRWLFGAFGAMLAVYLMAVAFTAVTLPFRTAQGVAEKVADPDNVVFQYEKFHNMCALIAIRDGEIVVAQKALDDHIKATKGQPDPLSRNADETARLRTDLTGLQQDRIETAQRYNADSRKLTQNPFKAGGLPYRVDESTPDCDGTPAL
jgi:hypothetical protein